MRKQISSKQIQDWSENPVTIEILALCEQELAEIQETTVTQCIFRGEPQKTQENLVELEAREAVWESWVALLSGDWSYFEEDEDE